jgi:hypothetical protein
MLSSRERLDAPIDDARADELHRLETLWKTPAATEPELELEAPSPAATLADRALAKLGWLLAATWIAFLASVILLAPASQEPAGSTPAWVEALIAGVWLALPLATIGALSRSAWLGYGASLSAAGMAVALSVACTTTGHHGGSWWLYELGGSVALAGLSVLGLRRARRAASTE